jgi:hypothetical protein
MHWFNPNAQAQRGERRNGVARVTPQVAQQGRFAARFAAQQGANFRADTAALAPRRAWSLGLRAAFVPWHRPVFWPYAYSTYSITHSGPLAMMTVILPMPMMISSTACSGGPSRPAA